MSYRYQSYAQWPLGRYRANRQTFYLFGTIVLGLSGVVMESNGVSTNRTLVGLLALVVPVRWFFYRSFHEVPRLAMLVRAAFGVSETPETRRANQLALSQELLSTLRNKRAPNERRYMAFQQIVALDSGWWGSAPLKDFAVANALVQVRKAGEQFVALVDREALAERMLADLYYSALERQTTPPEALLQEIAKEVVLEELEDCGLLTSRGTVTQFPNLATPSKQETVRLEEEDAFLDGIRSLPEQLRVVAHFRYVHLYSVREIGNILNLETTVIAHRIRRVREILSLSVRDEP